MLDSTLRALIATMLKSAADSKVNLQEEIVGVTFYLKSRGSPRSHMLRGVNRNGEPIFRTVVIGTQIQCPEAAALSVPYLFYSARDLGNLNQEMSLVESLVDSHDAFLVSESLVEPFKIVFGPLLEVAQKYITVIRPGMSLAQKVAEVKKKLEEDYNKEDNVSVEFGHAGMTVDEIHDSLYLAISYMIPEFKRTWATVKIVAMWSCTGPVYPMNWEM